MHAPGLANIGKRLAGITPQRDAPRFASSTFQSQWRRRPGGTDVRPGHPNAVLLWPDTFTNHFDPHIARSAMHVLENAGLHVAVPTQPVCCGLTWISTGQLNIAQRVLHRALRALRPWLEAGTPIVTLEPSCAAVFRSDSRELLPHDEDAARLRDQVHTFAETLQRHAPDWQPPRLERAAFVQRHCHQHAVLGFEADTELMHRAGINADIPDSGCCGLAGNFGFETRPLRRFHGLRRTSPISGHQARRAGHARPSGRVQLPHANPARHA